MEMAAGLQGVDVWWLPATVPDELREQLWRTLDETEKARLATIRVRDRAEALGSIKGLVRVVLGRYLGCAPSELRFDRNCVHCGADHGRLRLAGRSGPEFNLSHSGDLAVLSVSDEPVGVDVESLAALPRATELADTILSEVEARGVGEFAADGDLMLRYWVRKEAFLKLTGLGLSVVPRAVTTFEISAGTARVTDIPERIADYRGSVIVDLSAPSGYVAALAARRPVEMIYHHSLDVAHL